MKRYEFYIKQNDECLGMAISDWLNEEIEIKQAPYGSCCKNCFWYEKSDYSCTASNSYIGMQYIDCMQYRPIEEE